MRKKYYWIVLVSIKKSAIAGGDEKDGEIYFYEECTLFKKLNYAEEETYDFFYKQIITLLKNNHLEHHFYRINIKEILCLGSSLERNDLNEKVLLDYLEARGLKKRK